VRRQRVWQWGVLPGLRGVLPQRLGERGARALEESEPVRRAEVAAERQLQREGALVVGGLGGEELAEQLLARRGDAVRLAGAEPGAGPAADAGRGEVALE